jgi:hypothetical protein
MVSLVCLSACATLRTPIPNRCPAYHQYSKEEIKKLESAVSALPEKSPIIPALNEYFDLIDKLKACNKLS